MDRRLLESIYLQHRQGLFTLALSITRCSNAAEDAVHDAFAKLCSSGHRAETDLTAYVFLSVRNAAVDQIRRRAAALNPSVPIFKIDTPIQDEAAERGQIVQAALATLPEEQREVVVLKCFSDLTFEQIALVADTPLATVASRYRRGLERLRKELGVLIA